MSDVDRFRRNVVLVASAGTGKTHALVGVLLHALLGVSELRREPVDPARIAATTFSRKAAAEIRERLVRELERLAFGDANSSPYATALDESARSREVPWSAVRCAERARTALAGVDRATIGTLHGLAYGLVRKHAFAVGLPPSFAVASDDDNEAWAAAAVDLALRTMAEQDIGAIRDLFRLFRGRDRAQDELVRVLLALDEDGRPIESISLPERDEQELEASIRDLAPDDADALARGDVDALIDVVADGFGERSLRGNDARRALRDGLGGSSNRDRAAAHVHAWAARRRIAPTAALVRRILGHAQRELADLHGRAGAIGFGAALRLAREALRLDPAAADRASKALDALLVDEFQDTSRVQVDLIRLLWERSPLERRPGEMPRFGDLRPSGLLVVGDRKQSIYAFRGADVGVFVTTCIEIAGDSAREGLGIEPGLVPDPERVTGDFFALRENHRATRRLIAFVNAFSEECLVPESPELYEARYVRATEELRPAEASQDGCLPVWLQPAEEGEASRAEDAVASAAYIASATVDGAFAFRDFAVIAQSTEMLDATAFALARLGIPHVIAGRGFFAAREVRDLMDLLRWLERPSNRVALLSVLRGPCAALDERTILALTEPHGGLVTSLERWDVLERRALAEETDRVPLDRLRATLRVLLRARSRLEPGRIL